MKFRVTVIEKSISRVEIVVEAASAAEAERTFDTGEERNRELVDGCVERDVISIEEVKP